MEAQSKYVKDYCVEYGDVDYFKKIRLSKLFSYLQEISSLHSASLGIGIETLAKDFNVAWALVRMRVDVIKFPEWNQEITVETWPLEPKKLEFERDYFVKDKDGNVLVKAISSWVIIDLDERAIRKSELIKIDYPELITQRAIDCKFAKLKPFGECIHSYSKKIGYSDIDINGHLNNRKYIDYLMDCFSLEEHSKYEVSSIQVGYIKEALPGDNISFYKDTSMASQGIVYIEGVDEAGQKLFKAQVDIVPRK